MSNEQLSELDVPPHFTNIQHGLQLSRRFLAAQDTPNRQVILITDGLPTRGSSAPAGTTVSPEERLKHFERAARVVPSGIPVNTILLPMEGDAWAAAAFWKLAVHTRGSFMTPARDWP